MATIKQIDGRSIHQIQSGQVIVDLCSVVKELVENSLDAGATAIDVRFKNQGLESIEVQDNGSGISPANCSSVALKHFTSKLSSYSDISSLQTFGFRGEALASLCALSTLTVTTCLAQDAPKGTKLTFEQSGKLRDTGVIAAQRGTTVSVENLFHNLPVRRRELDRNIKREWQKVIALLNQYACIQINIKISVSHQPTKGKRVLLFSTKGNPSIRENVINIFGARTMTALVPLDLSMKLKPSITKHVASTTLGFGSDPKEVRIIGFVSRPVHGEGRHTPDRHMFFVNGRPCALPQFSKAFNDVYRLYNSSQSPFILADIRLDTDMYDVNVSPDKRSILLHDQSHLLDHLRNSLIDLFDAHDYSVPLAHPSSIVKQLPEAKRASGKAPFSRKQNPEAKELQHNSEPDSDADGDDAPESSADEIWDESVPTVSAARYETRQETSLIAMFARQQGTRVHCSGYIPTNPSLDSPGTRCEKDAIDENDRNGIESKPHPEPPGLGGNGSSHAKDSEISYVSTPILSHSIPKRPVNDAQLSQDITAERKGHGLIGNENPQDTIDDFSTRFDNIIVGMAETENFSSLAKLRLLTATSQPAGDSLMPQDDTHRDDLASYADLSAHRVQEIRDQFSRNIPLNDRAQSPDRPISVTEEHIELRLPKPASVGVSEQSFVRAIPDLKRTTANGVESSMHTLQSSSRRKVATNHLLQRLSITEPALQSSLQGKTNRMTSRQYAGIDARQVEEIGSVNAESKLPLIIAKSDFAQMRVAGQFNLGFILAVRPAKNRASGLVTGHDELFIIDQHASDEKYNFERLQSSTVIQAQRLVQPKRLHLTALEEEVLLENTSAIEANGFKVHIDTTGRSPVGSRCQLIALPLSREAAFSLEDLEELISLLGDDSSSDSSQIPRPSKVRKMLAMRACRSSVMIGKALTESQMYGIVKHMGDLDKPWNCPHGRPTMRHLVRLQTWDGTGWHADLEGSSLNMWEEYL